jgi:putative ATP-binding cassette transporter
MAQRNILSKLAVAAMSGPGPRWRRWMLLITVIAVPLAVPLISVQLVQWVAALTNAMAARDAAQFPHLVALLLVLIPLLVTVSIARTYLQQALLIDWRTGITEWLTSRWLQANAFYRVEREQLADNTDQRIAEDARIVVEQLLDPSTSLIDLLSTVVGFITYSALLWSVPGTLTFALGSHSFAIDGFMWWLAITYGIFLLLITHFTARPLIGVSFQQQKVEADFRFGLMQIREHAEQIALLDGGSSEKQRASDLFDFIRTNWLRVMNYTLVANFWQRAGGIGVNELPLLIMASRYLAGHGQMGDVQLVTVAFGSVIASMTWLVNVYPQIARLWATVQRLKGLDHALQRPSVAGIDVATSSSESITGANLQLKTPDGRVLTQLDSLTIAPGNRLLVQGPSGVGKSTLLRAIAGIWPYGAGRIRTPPPGQLHFMPQKNYLPSGTLKAALAYPNDPSTFTDPQCRQALERCRLPALMDALDVSNSWSTVLSPGEQQRVGFARILLHAPRFVFLDEATSALDLDTEKHLYATLIAQMPNAALVSVAHRTTLDAFHPQHLQVVPALT